MNRSLSSILLVLTFFIGLSVLLYPALSEYWNSKTQSRAIVDYESVIAGLKQEDYTDLFAEADAYNDQIRKVPFPLMNYGNVEGYNDLLKIDSKGIIGYISIDKIKVDLPVYHGTSNAVLNVAAGHLEGTSLPVGGASTHSVMSAHRGLPSAKLFTDLDKLEKGDTFTITVLDRVLTYEVDQILIVKPDEVDSLYVTEGRDYCTLFTCTPYAINTNRLLVRGTRIETKKEKPIIYVPPEAYMISPLVVTPLVAAPMLLILLIVLLIKYPKKRRKSKELHYYVN